MLLYRQGAMMRTTCPHCGGSLRVTVRKDSANKGARASSADTNATNRAGGSLPTNRGGGSLLTTYQAAEALGVSRVTIGRWIADGILRGVKENEPAGGWHWRIPAGEVERALRIR
jgi:excisionase family DNA binding protein